MLQFIKKLFRFNSTVVDFANLVKNGAIIIDVRTTNEYSGGHIKDSINIPLDQLSKNLHKLKSKEQVIITCCASGMRSSSAKGILKANGYQEVHNGGGWMSLKNKL